MLENHMTQDEPTDKVAEVAGERAEANFAEHLNEWLYGEPNQQEEFAVWLDETPARLADLAEVSSRMNLGDTLLEQLVYAWWDTEPVRESEFWRYADGVERGRYEAV